MNTLIVPRSLYDQIIDTIGVSPAESGGVFALNANCAMVKYYFDAQAGTGKRFYRPSADQISAQVNEWLREPGLRFGGYIHSHPPGQITLSPMDIVAAEMTIYKNRLPFLYMLILCEGRLFAYRVTPQQKTGHMVVESCTPRITK